MFDLKRLAHLVALADELHFARAAARVHLSQPAFSRSIQALEDETGMQLFDRAGGNVRPTPAGRMLIERARRLLFDARSLQHDLDCYRDGSIGDAAFGAGPFSASSLLARVLPALRREHPRMNLRIEVGNWHFLAQRLLGEQIEFFVGEVGEMTADSRLQVETTAPQPVGMFVRAGHPLAGRRCTLAEIWAHGVVTTLLPARLKRGIAHALGLPDGQLPPFAVECNQYDLLRQMTLSTDVVLGGLISGVTDELAAGTLVRLRFDLEAGFTSRTGIVSFRDRTLSPTAQRVVDAIRADGAAQALGAASPARVRGDS